MALGPGKYDDVCTEVREKTKAKGGVLLIVIGGDKGNGFSCQADAIVTFALPEMLEQIAGEIRKNGIGA